MGQVKRMEMATREAWATTTAQAVISAEGGKSKAKAKAWAMVAGARKEGQYITAEAWEDVVTLIEYVN